MSLTSALAAGRAAAERLMTDTCRITAPGTGAPVFDPISGTYTDPAPAVIYEGKCRLNVPGQIAGSQSASAGEASWTVQDSVLSILAGNASQNVAAGQTVEYLTAPHDPSLPGRKFGIIGQHVESQSTARRLRIREVTG